MDPFTISWTGGNRRDEFALDSNDRTRRGLSGSANDEGTNLTAGGLV